MSTRVPLAIEANKISRCFTYANEKQAVLSAFSHRFSAGSLTFVSGPNGSGKTVLAKILCGLLQPDEGNIIVGSKEYLGGYDHRVALAEGIHYIPQALPRLGSTTGAEFLASVDTHSVWYSGRRMALTATALQERHGLAIAHLMDRNLANITIAELQRLFVARALAAEPRLLILDEPTSSLSSQDSGELLRVLETLSERGITVIAITHPEQQFSRGTLFWLTTSGLSSSPTVPSLNLADLKAKAPPTPRAHRRIVVIKSQPDLVVRAKTIVSIMGPAHQEFSTFARRLANLDPSVVRLIKGRTPKTVYIPPDAVERLLAANLPLLDNVLIHLWDDSRWNYHGCVMRQKVNESLLQALAEEVDLNPRSPQVPVSHLSGGHRQRLVIARETLRPGDLLVAVNLFRGLDNRGVQRMARYLFGLRRKDLAIILLHSRPGVETQIADAHLEFSDGGIERTQ